MTWLDWPDCRNVRDVGGAEADNGTAIRPGALVRSGHHGDLTADGLAALHAYGVRRIIDLRRASECDVSPSPFATDPIYVDRPVDGDGAGLDDVHGLVELYRRLLDHSARQFAHAVGAIADAPRGVVVVHCHGGKDRTGLVLALALGAVGATRRAIVDDYALSETDERSARLVAAHLATSTSAAERDRRRARSASPAAAMQATLDHLDTAYGGIIPYLCGAGGLEEDRIDALRARLLPSHTV